MPFTSASPDAFMALGIQTALGTPQVTAAKLRFARYLSGNNFGPDDDIVDLREGGGGLDFLTTYARRKVTRGQLVVYARPEIVGQLLLPVLIGAATWGGGSAPATHLAHTNHASYPWTTILAAHPGTDLTHILSDVRFQGFTLEVAAGEPWKITAPYLAINRGASYAIVAPTYYGDDFWLMHSAPSYQLQGVADTNITGFKITQELGVDELQAQDVTLDEAPVTNRDLNIEITRRYENAALWRTIAYGASAGVSPTTTVATGAFRAIAVGASALAIDLNVPLISWRSDVLTELNPDGETVMETISGKILKGATHSLIGLVSNLHASAY